MKIKIFDSKGTHVLPFAKSSVTLGRAAHCDVVIDDPSVHPEHARAWLEGGRIWVQDLGSPAGTSLNDIRLPALKPMLLRDLDVVRLGTSEATLGLEPVLVRAPVVKSPIPHSASDPVSVAGPARGDAKNDPQRDLEMAKRRETLAQLGRELAELRLQLQMKQLESQSADDVSHQARKLQDEIQSVQLVKEKWTETLRQLDRDKVQLRQDVESKLKEFKTRQAEDLKAMERQQEQQLIRWKKDVTGQILRQAHESLDAKLATWTDRPVSRELIGEWESDLRQVLHRLILQEEIRIEKAVAPRPPVKAKVAQETPPATVAKEATPTPAASEAPVVEEVSAPSEGRKKLRAPKVRIRLKPVGLGVLAMLTLAGGARFALSWGRSHGSHSLSSQSVEARPAEKSGALRFRPKAGKKYRDSYTDNVLYLQDYIEAEQNPAFHNLWHADLNRAATDTWKVDHFPLVPVLNKESAMLNDLIRLKEKISPEHEQDGIEQMRAREAQFIQELEVLLKGRPAVDRFLKFKRSFYTRNQVYLTHAGA